MFSAFYVALILALILTIAFSWTAIERSYKQKEVVYQVVRFAQNARIAEKSYLKYHKTAYEQELVSACLDILSAFKVLSGQVHRDKIDVIQQDIRVYRQMFNNIIAGHRKMIQVRQDIYECVNLMTAQAERLKFSANRHLKEIVKECFYSTLELGSLYDQFLTEGKDAYLDKFSKKVKNVFSVKVAQLTSFGQDEQNPELWPILREICEVFEKFKQVPEVAKEAFVLEQTSVNRMDQIGTRISLNADVLLTEAEVLNAAIKQRVVWLVVSLTFIGSLLAIGFGIMFNQLISEALNRVVRATHALAEGDLTTRIQVKTKDEIGQMASSFNTFIERFQRIIKEVDENTDILSSASSDLTDTSNNLTLSVEKMNLRATKVAKTGGELSSDVDFMATSAEEISASARHVSSSVHDVSESIHEVSAKCAKESNIARLANQKAQETHYLMKKLNNAAEKIGMIVQFINQIADQTNLLALNAHIEAASSGEAGKGFAVVASEIKDLAQRSAKATEEIAQQIAHIQKDIEVSVKEIDAVTKIIEEVSGIAASIAKVVEAQSSATSIIADTVKNTSHSTNELAQKIQRAARGAVDVSQNIQEINLETQEAAKGATETFNSSEALAKMAARLKKSIRQFKV